MSEDINHIGFVEKIENGVVYVRIDQYSACSGCHARTICSASEKKEKIIEVADRSGAFHTGENVMICGRNSMGLQAVVLAFVIPLVIVVCAITAGTSLRWDETMSGLAGLLLLLPYYYILYLTRDKLRKKFVFTLKKLN